MEFQDRTACRTPAPEAGGDPRLLAWLVQSAHDAIFCVSLDGIVLSWNAAATALFGFSAQDAIGSDMRRFIPPHLRHREAARLPWVQAGNDPDEVETERLHSDGRRIPVVLRHAPVRQPDGTVVGVSIIARSATPQQSAQRQAAQYRDIVIHASDGILVVDAQQTIRYANPAAQRLFGAGPSDLTGQPLDMLIPPAYHARHSAQVHGFAVDGGAPRQMGAAGRTVLARHLSGEVIPVEVTISKFGSGQDVQMTALIRDGRPQLEAERLRQAAQRAVSANEAKSRFVARLSHELRTPASVVIGFARLLARDAGVLSGRARDLVHHIQSAGTHMLALLDDLLDTARIESGTMRMALTPQPVRPMLDELLSQLGPLASVSSVTMSVAPGGPPEPCAMADPTRLRQVLYNLLTNAIKYNRPAGRVLVVLRSEEGRLCIDVCDTGAGMHAQQLAELFKPYKRLGLEDTDIPGLGLGLTVARELVLRMGGQLLVNSSPGCGTTFTLQLRQASPQATDSAPALPQSAPDALSTASQAPAGSGWPATGSADALDEPAWAGPSCKLLCVDDSPLNRLLVDAMLQGGPQMKLAFAVDAQSARQQVQAIRPDLVLLDLDLPDEHGLTWLHKLRQDPIHGRTKVLIFSATLTPDDREAARELGALDFVPKPVSAEQLRQAVCDALRPD